MKKFRPFKKRTESRITAISDKILDHDTVQTRDSLEIASSSNQEFSDLDPLDQDQEIEILGRKAEETKANIIGLSYDERYKKQEDGTSKYNKGRFSESRNNLLFSEKKAIKSLIKSANKHYKIEGNSDNDVIRGLNFGCGDLRDINTLLKEGKKLDSEGKKLEIFCYEISQTAIDNIETALKKEGFEEFESENHSIDGISLKTMRKGNMIMKLCCCPEANIQKLEELLGDSSFHFGYSLFGSISHIVDPDERGKALNFLSKYSDFLYCSLPSTNTHKPEQREAKHKQKELEKTQYTDESEAVVTDKKKEKKQGMAIEYSPIGMPEEKVPYYLYTPYGIEQEFGKHFKDVEVRINSIRHPNSIAASKHAVKKADADFAQLMHFFGLDKKLASYLEIYARSSNERFSPHTSVQGTDIQQLSTEIDGKDKTRQ